jgi:hypothetical protein
MSDLSPQIVMERLDAISRTRALTDAESITLEKAIRALSAEPGTRCTKRDAARAGIKRDMSVYTKKSRSDQEISRKIDAAKCAAATLRAKGYDFDAEQIEVLCRAARALHTTASMQRKDLDELRAQMRAGV